VGTPERSLGPARPCDGSDLSLLPPLSVTGLWSACASRGLHWLDAQGLARRDAVLLLPFSALLAPARSAFAACGGWQPRIETPLTLAASLGPPPVLLPEACTGHAVIDRLNAATLLGRSGWAERWRREDPGGFDRLVASFVDAAHLLRSAALSQPPQRRDEWLQGVRDALPASAGPGALETLLLRSALEWVALEVQADTDRLFGHRPSAWMLLELGGRDALCEAVLAHATVPVLRLSADPDSADPFALGGASSCSPAEAVGEPEQQMQRWLCAGFEAEAQAAAACVIQALNSGAVPVALVALDRELVRRVRALLARQDIPLVDETGWKLSTTTAANRIGSLLAAAQAAGLGQRAPEGRHAAAVSGNAPTAPDDGPADSPAAADRDAWLEWLKQWPPADDAALRALESHWRGQRLPTAAQAAGTRLLRRAHRHLALHFPPPATSPAGEAPLGDWLRALMRGLQADGTDTMLAADEAGRQVLAALHLNGLDDSVFERAADVSPMGLAAFAAWVSRTLESASYLPPADTGAEVVLTPLSRAIGRPFATVVLAGADAKRLGAVDRPPGLISDALASRLGLPDARQRRERQRLALAQLTRTPALLLLRRHREGDEPLAESPDVEWLLLRRAEAGQPPVLLQPWVAERAAVTPTPQPPPRPVAAGCLPTRLSASQLEALRACPYRFFARAVLRLSEPDEVDTPLEKRDYGTWLHEVLHRFHQERSTADLEQPPALEEADAHRLAAAADAVSLRQQRDAAAMLPFRAAFDALAPDYLRWLHEREAAGWRWQAGELDIEARFDALAAVAGPTLRGRVDRVDRLDPLAPSGGQQQRLPRHDAGAAPVEASGLVELLDYKTGGLVALEQRVATPFEDTQLAFYAALLLGSTAGPPGGEAEVKAAYLAMDGAGAPLRVEHEDVQTSARALVLGLAGEWQRMQAGTPLPALGEGPVCQHCEARGLCRRDHWSAS
jgi:ATP-dependent helicase/nuclease subunit B